MGVAEIVALGTIGLAMLGSLGGVVKWAAGKFERQETRFERQGERLAKIEKEYAALYRDHSIVLVKLERTRLAFQMVATELARKSPGNNALALAASLLDEAYKVDPDIPPEMQAALDKLDHPK